MDGCTWTFWNTTAFRYSFFGSRRHLAILRNVFPQHYCTATPIPRRNAHLFLPPLLADAVVAAHALRRTHTTSRHALPRRHCHRLLSTTFHNAGSIPFAGARWPRNTVPHCYHTLAFNTCYLVLCHHRHCSCSVRCVTPVTPLRAFSPICIPRFICGAFLGFFSRCGNIPPLRDLLRFAVLLYMVGSRAWVLYRMNNIRYALSLSSLPHCTAPYALVRRYLPAPVLHTRAFAYGTVRATTCYAFLADAYGCPLPPALPPAHAPRTRRWFSPAALTPAFVTRSTPAQRGCHTSGFATHNLPCIHCFPPAWFHSGRGAAPSPLDAVARSCAPGSDMCG